MSKSEEKTGGYQRKRARTHKRLLAAGVSTYAELGGKMTVRDIIEAAEVSNGTFYNYFSDLDEFVEAIITQVLMGIVEGVALSGSEDPARRFATATYQVLDILRAQPEWAWVVLRVFSRHQPIPDFTQFITADLKEGHASGRFSLGMGPFTVELIFGAMLMTLRRIATGSMTQDTLCDFVQFLLETLGVPPNEARALVRDASSNPT